MITEQFKWKGNGSIEKFQGYPANYNATWPAGRYLASLSSTKDLLWLFGGYIAPYLNGDLSTFSDGMTLC